MSVELEPSELSFKRSCAISLFDGQFILTARVTGPFNREICEVLQISNKSSEPVVFKVFPPISVTCCQAGNTSADALSRMTGQNHRTETVRYHGIWYHCRGRCGLINTSYCVRPNSGRVDPGKRAEVQGQ